MSSDAASVATNTGAALLFSLLADQTQPSVPAQRQHATRIIPVVERLVGMETRCYPEKTEDGPGQPATPLEAFPEVVGKQTPTGAPGQGRGDARCSFTSDGGGEPFPSQPLLVRTTWRN